jgi:hypothetical protein
VAAQKRQAHRPRDVWHDLRDAITKVVIDAVGLTLHSSLPEDPSDLSSETRAALIELLAKMEENLPKVLANGLALIDRDHWEILGLPRPKNWERANDRAIERRTVKPLKPKQPKSTKPRKQRRKAGQSLRKRAPRREEKLILDC